MIFTAIAVKTSVFVHKGIVIFTKTYIITAIAVKNMDFSKGKLLGQMVRYHRGKEKVK